MSLQKEIIQTLKVRPSIDAREEIRRSIDFMKDYLLSIPGLESLVMGISGGQDSTLAGKLAQRAIEELRAETGNDRYRFIAVRLPYGDQLDEEDAKRALEFIRPDQIFTVNIQEATDQIVQAVAGNNLFLNDFNIGNIKARQRMVVQFAIAGECRGIVVGTDIAAEALTGFYTKFGDGAADIMPIWRLNKRQGRQLLEHLGAAPELYLKIPTADLESNQPLQSDEDALGVTYEAIDDYLEGKAIDAVSQERIETLYRQSQHKRHLPINVYDDFWRMKE